MMAKDNNSGNRNSGNWNSGYWNSGDRNSGYRNSGNRNSGYWNSGYRNSSNRNSGNRNSGDLNSGDLNSGYRNSGDLNSGDWNSGNWNSGYWNSGYLNTDEPTVRMFNNDTGKTYEEINGLIPDFFWWDNNEWIESAHMTDSEKKEHPEHNTTGGFLRVKEYKQAWREAWDKATEEDRKKCLSLPNWNNKIFLEITGIDVEKELNSKDTVEIGGQRYLRSEVESKLKDLRPAN